MQLKPNHFLKKIKPYHPGKSVSDFNQNKSLVKLSSNENPYGSAIDDLNFQFNDINEYPKKDNHQLINKLASTFGFDQDYIFLGNGSDEIFQSVALTFLDSQSESLSAEHTFSVYQSCTEVLGATYRPIPMTQYSYDLNRILDEITHRTKIIFIANPNNPTGHLLSHDEIKQFLDYVPPSIIVVLDEAYREYITSEDPLKNLSLVQKHSNLIITRTFSKLYGFAGLRLGFGIAQPQLVAILKKVTLPFNINSIALRAGIMGIENTAFIEKSLAANQEGLAKFMSSSHKWELEILSSEANFICLLLKNETCTQLCQYFLNHGYIVRDLTSFGLSNGIRITIGKPFDVDQCIDILNKYYQ